MKNSLRGAALWITGAASGLGAAIAVGAARRQARLLLSDRRVDALHATAAACHAARGPEAAPRADELLLPFDLSDPAARAASIGNIPGLFGEVDVLVLAGGLSQRSTFLDMKPAVFDYIMEVDFRAQVELIRACLPGMLERGRGAVLIISSLAGLAGAPLRSAYSAAKHALAGLAQSLRAETRGSGVRIVTVYPGFVRTGIGAAALDAEGKSRGIEDPRIAGGADPAACARRILDAALRGPVEIKVGFDATARAALFLSRRLPSLWAALSSRELAEE